MKKGREQSTNEAGTQPGNEGRKAAGKRAAHPLPHASLHHRQADWLVSFLRGGKDTFLQ